MEGYDLIFHSFFQHLIFSAQWGTGINFYRAVLAFGIFFIFAFVLMIFLNIWNDSGFQEKYWGPSTQQV
jgi:hypothetical protein